MLKPKSLLKKLTEEAKIQNVNIGSKKKNAEFNPESFKTPTCSKTKSIYESYNKTDTKGKSSKPSQFQSNMKQGCRAFLES